MSDATTKMAAETPLLALHKRAGATVATWFGCALPDTFGDWQAEYRAARENVALIDKNYRMYLRFSGPDRVRYLNAILTNNIKDLAAGDGVVSLFLNPQGRIQAEIETYATTDSLFCVSYAMVREMLAPALDKFIIMDDVTLTDETDTFGTVALEGRNAAEIAKKLTSINLGDLKELSFQETAVAGISLDAGGFAATLESTSRSGRKRGRKAPGLQSSECFETGARYSVVWLRLRRQADSA